MNHLLINLNNICKNKFNLINNLKRFFIRIKKREHIANKEESKMLYFSFVIIAQNNKILLNIPNFNIYKFILNCLY